MTRGLIFPNRFPSRLTSCPCSHGHRGFSEDFFHNARRLTVALEEIRLYIAGNAPSPPTIIQQQLPVQVRKDRLRVFLLEPSSWLSARKGHETLSSIFLPTEGCHLPHHLERYPAADAVPRRFARVSHGDGVPECGGERGTLLALPQSTIQL